MSGVLNGSCTGRMLSQMNVSVAAGMGHWSAGKHFSSYVGADAGFVGTSVGTAQDTSAGCVLRNRKGANETGWSLRKRYTLNWVSSPQSMLSGTQAELIGHPGPLKKIGTFGVMSLP